MQPNFEKINSVDLSLEQTIENISEAIKKKGFWMNKIDQVDDDIRFQVWKDKDGLPMTYQDGVRELIEEIRSETDIIPDDATLEFGQGALGAVFISIKLDKNI